MTSEDKRLHDLSFANQKMLLKSNKCGCYYCGRIFKPSEITEWIKDKGGKTALCPYCGIDAVLQEASDGSYILDEKLLKRMNKVWFNGDTD